MKNHEVRVAQAGIANHGRTILNAIRDSGNLKLVSCFDIHGAANEGVAKEFGARPASNFEELVHNPDVEAVALVTPNHLHAAQLRTAATAGKHVFVEKPIANTVAEAREMIDLMRSAGLVLMTGHNTRRRRVFRRAKLLLHEGVLGKIVAVEANLSRPAGLQPGLPAWKADPSKCALLPMMQLGIHFIDTISYLLQPVQRVSCFAANTLMPGSVFDSTAAILQLESGIPVSLTSYYVSADAYFLRIYGTEGTLHCFPTRMKLELLHNGELAETREEDFSAEGSESYILQMKEFGECVRSGKTPETGGEEGIRALAVIEAMVASVTKRSVVEVDEILMA